MPTRLQLRRGLKVDLPTDLKAGEPAFCTDTGDLYVNDGSKNVKINEDARIGDTKTLTTTEKSSIVGAINELKNYNSTNTSTVNSLSTKIGTLASLTTTAKGDIVSAINEVKGMNIPATRVTTDDTHKFVQASQVSGWDGLTGKIGVLTSLTTTAKGSLVEAINEIKASINQISTAGGTQAEINRQLVGTLANLKTDIKDNTVNAINELFTRTLENNFVVDGDFKVEASWTKGVGASYSGVSGFAQSAGMELNSATGVISKISQSLNYHSSLKAGDYIYMAMKIKSINTATLNVKTQFTDAKYVRGYITKDGDTIAPLLNNTIEMKLVDSGLGGGWYYAITGFSLAQPVDPAHSKVVVEAKGYDIVIDDVHGSVGRGAESFLFNGVFALQSEIDRIESETATIHHTHGDSDITALSASKLTGTIDVARLPTSGIPFSSIAGRPTSLSAYGITDGVTTAMLTSKIGNLATLNISGTNLVDVINSINTSLTTVKNNISTTDGKIGDITTLSTTNKSNVVSAINELVTKNSQVIDVSRLPNIPIDKLPKGALEQIKIVANSQARLALTTADVQVGDTVKQTDNNQLYVVIDDTKLNSEAGYMDYTSTTASAVPWSGVTGKPTSLSGFGITDAVTIASLNSKMGDFTTLPTTAKDNIVNIIKELNTKISSATNSIALIDCGTFK